MLKVKTTILPLTMSIAITLPLSALAEHITLPEVSVEQKVDHLAPYTAPPQNTSSSNAAESLSDIPGAAINRNGASTGIVQYRGMYANRVNVKVDGQSSAVAGPNRMDPPLSTISGLQLDSLSIYRGIAPVSSGVETIGGSVVVTSKKVHFGDSDTFKSHGDIGALYNDNGDDRALSVITGISNNHHRFQINGSIDKSGNQSFPDGYISPTKHDRNNEGLGYGYKNDNLETNIKYDHLDVGNSGTPALPMDIIYVRGDNLSGDLSSNIGGGKLTTKLHYQDTNHRMDNYSLRSKPTAKQRYSDADVIAKGLDITYSRGLLSYGLSGDTETHNANIFNPNKKKFYVTNFNDIERNRLSGFVQWDGQVSPDWRMQSGVRLTQVHSAAGEVDTSMAMNMAGAKKLRNDFNNSNRTQDDLIGDIVANFTHPINKNLGLDVGLARKQRAPSYQERYLWLPLSSAGGLADGKNYIGNVNLDPETSYQLELGLNWQAASSFKMTPHVFYHRVDNYIQGVTSTNMTANMVSHMMNAGAGTPLQFQNVDAELYGFDSDWLWSMIDNWQLNGTVSYVRGKRRDTGDNLYRIAPLTAKTRLSFIQSKWRTSLEMVSVAAQNDVSKENSEQKTSGYAYFNLSGQYNVTSTLNLQAGVNNVLDRRYDDHLAGYNRVSGNSDLAVGEQIPGLGRSAYVSMNYNW